DFDIIGTTEHLEETLVLLQNIYSLPLLPACDLHIHNASYPYSQVFQSPKRPEIRKIFSDNVTNYLRRKFHVEISIWEYASTLQVEALKKYGYTMASAKSIWESNCKQ